MYWRAVCVCVRPVQLCAVRLRPLPCRVYPQFQQCKHRWQRHSGGLPIRSAQVRVPGIVAVAVIGRMTSKSTDELCASGWYLSQAKQLWVYHTVAAVSTRSGAAGRSEAADYDTRCSCDSQKPEAQLQYSRPAQSMAAIARTVNYSRSDPQAAIIAQ